MENKGLHMGIFVAPNGISEGRGDDKVYGASGQIAHYLRDGYKIAILENADIVEILDCKDVTEKVNDKFMYLYS